MLNALWAVVATITGEWMCQGLRLCNSASSERLLLSMRARTSTMTPDVAAARHCATRSSCAMSLTSEIAHEIPREGLPRRLHVPLHRNVISLRGFTSQLNESTHIKKEASKIHIEHVHSGRNAVALYANIMYAIVGLGQNCS